MSRRSPKASEGLRSWWRAQRSPRGFGGHLRRGLLRCSCLQPTQKERPSQQSGPATEPEESMENVQMITEDVGMDNAGFSLEEEDGRPRQRRPLGCSLSSVSAHCSLEKKIRCLTSLPLHHKVSRSGQTTWEKEKVREEPVSEGAELLKEDGIDTFLTPPTINLIPPTPSGIIDKDQFFEINAEEDDGLPSSNYVGVDGMKGVDINDQQTLREGEEVEGDTKDGDPADEPAGSDREEHAEAFGEDPSVVARFMEGQVKRKLQWGIFQVPPLPQYPRKRSFCTGINLLKFTEQNLDDLNDKDAGSRESPRAERRFLPLSFLDARLHVRKAVVRTCSLGNPVPRSHTFHSARTGNGDHGSPRRRITIASYMSQSRDQNRNYSREVSDWRGAKPLTQLDTDETCQWFSDIGLHRCIPLVRGAGLQGSRIASIDQTVLDCLQVSAVEERERLLSAVYRELHPPDDTTRAVDSLLETLGCSDMERFVAALASMSKSRCCPRMSHSSRDKGRCLNTQRSSDSVELTIKGPDQMVHLRTPREISVGKVLDSCLETLGLQEDRKLFSLKSMDGSSVTFSVDQTLGNLPCSEKKVLELQLCRKEKPQEAGSVGSASWGSGTPAEDTLANQQGKENTWELSEQVDSLQGMVQQIQELHQSLVSFYSEMRSMENDLPMVDLSLAELEKQLELTHSQRKETQQKLEALQAQLSVLVSKTHRRPETQLLEKMKLDAQLFKEEIRLVQLGRQVAQLQVAQKQLKTQELTRRKGSTLAGLVSPQCPALLLLFHESQGKTGGYGFTARYLEGRGLVVVQAQNSHLQCNDRLLEVNGVDVVDGREEELAALLHPPSSGIVVLRQAPTVAPWDPAQTSLPPLPPHGGGDVFLTTRHGGTEDFAKT